MARHRRKRTQNQGQSRLERLPFELQLVILENMSSCEDLTLLVATSYTLCAVYDQYKKSILAIVIQRTLGEAFIEACMLQHWRNNIDTNFGENEPWDLDQPYRHIQLKFIHEWCEHSTASSEDQIQTMKRLLTAEDFEQILKFYATVVKPLSRPFIEKPTPEHDFTTQFPPSEPDPTPLAPWRITATERQRIMRTLYRYEICSRLYGPHFESTRAPQMGLNGSLMRMVEKDFFGMFDANEIEELRFVYVGLALELHKSWKLIESATDWRGVLGARPEHAALYSAWSFSYYSGSRRLIGLGGLVEGALAMGLEPLSAVRSAATADDVAKILLAKTPPDVEGFIWGTLSQLEEAHHFSGGDGPARPESWSDEFWG
ncbi:hypothetical protein KVR01_009106 [Diaporthe batatas]|uniref:uncharacterized protein n=1 Tax=Diaporthe batatas TaxID=748121 RepID=UPI001D0397F6|nr:uncharacterized protein KVR01_009106 [Diaporthe batatas]KAG8160842.1 hypothetical protein KVR01_009106 [Diaporthe batatas]